MAQFYRLEVINEIVRVGFIPIFYHPDLEVSKNIVQACVLGGARVIEFTNRGDNAYRVFSDLVTHFAKAEPSVILGVGSVLDPATGALYISSGANFIVGSVLNPELAKTCNRRKVLYCPGCSNASEISLAEELGAEFVKIFPGDTVGGPNFVKAIKGPTPWTRIIATGGVEATQESINGWFTAGVCAVGIGSNLIRKEWLKPGQYETITDLVSKIMTWIRLARNGNIFEGVEHVGFYGKGTVDAKEIVEWYKQKFGFSSTENKSSIMTNDPAAGSIEVMKTEESDHCHIAIKVSDFETACDNLLFRGVEIDVPIIKSDYKAVYLKQTDPLGNKVHLIWRR